MIPIVSLLMILATSLIVTRIASVALEHTGLSRDSARFQARSAFTGVGFTTSEAEQVVGDPVRRRVVMWLMLVGNVGFVSGMVAVLLSALDLRSESGAGLLGAVLVAGLVLLWAVTSSRWLDRQMCRAISWALRRFTTLDARDYALLLHLRDEYGISRLRLEAGDWIAGRTLGETCLSGEGVLVLGIECPGGNYMGAPPADVELRAGDELVLYGPAARVAELATRRANADGDRVHDEASAEQRERTGLERRHAGR
jgi:hypothetical protein